MTLEKRKQLNNNFLFPNVVDIQVGNGHLIPDVYFHGLEKMKLLFSCFLFPDVYFYDVRDKVASLDVMNSMSG